jgi:hypothetical protein
LSESDYLLLRMFEVYHVIRTCVPILRGQASHSAKPHGSRGSDRQGRVRTGRGEPERGSGDASEAGP